MSSSENRLMKVLVVTGGIGAGKSYVCSVFSSLGVPVYDSDSRTKALYDSDPVLLSMIAQEAGADVVRDGVLDRGLFARRIFSDTSLLRRIEAVVYPRVMEDFRVWKEGFSEEETPFVIMESAVFLMKPMLYPVADRVLYVDAPAGLRISRVMARDGVCREQVEARISNQEDRREMADWVIDTSSGEDAVHRDAKRVFALMKAACVAGEVTLSEIVE